MAPPSGSPENASGPTAWQHRIAELLYHGALRAKKKEIAVAKETDGLPAADSVPGVTVTRTGTGDQPLPV